MTRLSNRQWPMLRALYDNMGGFMTIEQAQKFDQRPFRSMLIQGWCAFRPGRGFHITPEGKAAMHEFQDTDIKRKHPEFPLTKYFDITAYSLHQLGVKAAPRSAPSKKATGSVREMLTLHRRGAA
jgi:hypothetical protein